jgi:predicted choloylglycine hydrolase
MFKRFMAVREDEPGDAWRARFAAGRDEAVRWYLGSGRGPPPSPVECRAALRHHMPELIPHYDKACALVGDDNLAHCILSHYRQRLLSMDAVRRFGSAPVAQLWFETMIFRSMWSRIASS